ncbi:MAG: DNA-nicking Smr family endonuclease [Halioglobus sp.]|jgi:DNA-nicking Smr family endonuclease
MNSDEDSGFLEEMADVVPLQREPRIDLHNKTQRDRDSSLEQRRLSAVQAKESDRNTLTDQRIAALDPWFVLEFKRPGIQNGVFRKMKQGRYEAEARLDLHRMTVAIARDETFGFIEEAHHLGLRSVLIIHGKGENTAEQQSSAVLKGYVNYWLRELDIVQAFHSARRQHGGTGAVYVLLRKSEERKRENREKFSKGRIPYEPT